MRRALELLGGILHPDVRIIEHPNAINPRGSVRNRSEALAAYQGRARSARRGAPRASPGRIDRDARLGAAGGMRDRVSPDRTAAADATAAPGRAGTVRALATGRASRARRRAGFDVEIIADAAGHFVYATEEIALRGLMSSGPCVNIARQAGEDAVANAIRDGIAPFRQVDGSHRFENTWRFAIGRKRY